MPINKTIGKNRNTTDKAFTPQITLNATTATKVSSANTKRIFFEVNNNEANKDFWLRLYPADKDNLKRGIFITSKTGSRLFWCMPSDNIYTGEISAISDTGGPVAYVTEY